MNDDRGVALVTGASTGIGRETARRLAERGWRVFGTSRRPGAEGADGVTMLAMDLRDGGSVDRCVATVLARAGRIDLLVDNAATLVAGAVEEVPPAEAAALLDANVVGTVRVVQAVLPGMRARGAGRIVTVTGALGLVAWPYLGVYSASKFALEGLTQALRAEVAPFGIIVALVAPGPTRTAFADVAAPRQLPAYAQARNRSVLSLRDALRTGDDPAVAARAIVRAAEARAPRLRTSSGLWGTVMALVLRRLPGGLVERVMGLLTGGMPAVQRAADDLTRAELETVR